MQLINNILFVIVAIISWFGIVYLTAIVWYSAKHYSEKQYISKIWENYHKKGEN